MTCYNRLVDNNPTWIAYSVQVILQEVNPDAENFTDSTIPESNPISSVVKERNCFLPKECLSSIRSITGKEVMAHSSTSTRLVVSCA